MNFIYAASPIFLFVILLLILRIKIQYVAAVTFALTALIAIWKWSIPLNYLGSAVGKGSLITLDILLIIFGAIVFLNYLKKIGVIDRLESLLSSLSPDRRIQAIVLAWFFGSFIEGTSGFGTPALVVAPLLVGIGFPALMSILVCLIANSTAVAFGAVGTPVRIGFAELAVSGIPEKAALINLMAGGVVPLLIVAFVVASDRQQRVKAFLECAPWALFAGLSFLLPYYFISYLGYEFPSIFGSAVGLALAVVSIRLKFLIPKNIFRFKSDSPIILAESSPELLKSLIPYLLLLIILLGGKMLLSSWRIAFDLGQGLIHNVQIFNPGFAFLTAILLLNFKYACSFSELSILARSSFALIRKTAIAIFCVAAMTYTMVLTDINTAEGMLQVIAKPLANQNLPLFSVFIGAFGSFLAGSATVSNLLLGPIQAQAAEQLGYSLPWILALQLVGAGVGNMIALPNLLAVEAAVGIHDQESQLLRRLILPCFVYLVLAAIIGQLIIDGPK